MELLSTGDMSDDDIVVELGVEELQEALLLKGDVSEEVRVVKLPHSLVVPEDSSNYGIPAQVPQPHVPGQFGTGLMTCSASFHGTQRGMILRPSDAMTTQYKTHLRLPVGPPCGRLPQGAHPSTLQEKFAAFVMCDFTPTDPSKLPLALWVSCECLIGRLQLHAPREASELGCDDLKQLITGWYTDHPAFSGLPFSAWCKKLKHRPGGYSQEASSRRPIFKFSFQYTPSSRFMASMQAPY